MRRTSRWAIIIFKVFATKNGSPPMSMNRGIAVGASLVWSVESTRWPVMAALSDMDTVSSSRISPTMIISGFWRIRLRKPLANVMPALGFTCVWLMRSTSYSIGSSIVAIFTVGVLSLWRIAYSVVVLPEPVGPVIRIIPNVRLMASLMVAMSRSDMPSSERFSGRMDPRKRRITTFSP